MKRQGRPYLSVEGVEKLSTCKAHWFMLLIYMEKQRRHWIPEAWPKGECHVDRYDRMLYGSQCKTFLTGFDLHSGRVLTLFLFTNNFSARLYNHIL